jgi:transcriptional regulator with XRE-family HTH domain
VARNLDDMIAGLSAERRARIQRRTQEMLAEVDSLQAVRKLAGKTQEQIAGALGKKQPSVQKMEKQADFYVSTLRRFVEAAGGTVEIRVSLPGQETVVLREFSDLHS